MNIMPRWNELLSKTLKAFADGNSHKISDVKVEVADSLGLPEDLRSELTEKVRVNKIEDRVSWAIYIGLKKALLVEDSNRGELIITKRGKDLLAKNIDFDDKYLVENYKEYKDYLASRNNSSKEKRKNNENLKMSDVTPSEMIENAIEQLDDELDISLLGELRKMNPYKFEIVVADVLKAMGYGESFITKKSNDGGVDAIVNEDALGLSKIYAQAKRYAEDNIVHKTAIRDFLGSLAENKTNKGVFITTSDYADDAKKLAENHSLILINGDKLAKLMIEYEVGVSVAKTYKVKKINSAYFE
jgi:restriction system protein